MFHQSTVYLLGDIANDATHMTLYHASLNLIHICNHFVPRNARSKSILIFGLNIGSKLEIMVF